MFNMHTTKEGESIPIAMMDDQHLMNTIRMILRPAIGARKQAEGTNESELTELDRELYGLTVVDSKQIANGIQRVVESAYPYLAEAILRGLQVRQVLVLVMRRSAALGKPGYYLTSGRKNDDDDVFDDGSEEDEIPLP